MQTDVGLHSVTLFFFFSFVFCFFLTAACVNEQKSAAGEKNKKERGYRPTLGRSELTPSSVPLTSAAFETKLVLR